MRTSIDLPDDLYAAARHAAIDRRISLRALIETAVRQLLNSSTPPQAGPDRGPRPRKTSK